MWQKTKTKNARGKIARYICISRVEKKQKK